MKADFPLLLRNAVVFDGTGSPGRPRDLLVRDGRISWDIPAELAGVRVLDLEGCLISPGWVDLHVHVFSGQGIFSLPPEDIGLSNGVTTLVDAGSAGALNYPLFDQAIRARARERVVGYVNVSSGGLLHGHAGERGFVGDHFHAALHSEDAALALHSRFGDSIAGWKIRLSAVLAENDEKKERSGFATLLELKSRTGLPVMVHHVKSHLPAEEVLAALDGGDVYTHCYHGCGNSPFEEGSCLPKDAALAARRRGVLFDVGHGAGAFRWNCADQACRMGEFWPDTISSDLHHYNLFSPVRDLAKVMSKFLLLGASPGQVIAAVTGNTAPALRAVGISPSLAEGRRADLTIFQIQDGEFEFGDCHGDVRRGNQRFVPLAVLRGDILTPCYGFHLRDSDSDALARSWQTII